MRLPCADDRPRPVQLVTPPRRPWYHHGRTGAILARGTVAPGDFDAVCRADLRFTAAGRRHRRPVPAVVRHGAIVGWTFRLR